MKANLFIWVVRIIAAGIFIQTLFFKFTGAPESVAIFTQMGIEPYGRIGAGIGELIAAILIVIPRTTAMGAIIGIAVISGAIFSHIFVLGIEVENDGGTLFTLALITFFCCGILIYYERHKILNCIQLKI